MSHFQGVIGSRNRGQVTGSSSLSEIALEGQFAHCSRWPIANSTRLIQCTLSHTHELPKKSDSPSKVFLCYWMSGGRTRDNCS